MFGLDDVDVDVETLTLTLRSTSKLIDVDVDLDVDLDLDVDPGGPFECVPVMDLLRCRYRGHYPYASPSLVDGKGRISAK